MSDGSPAAGETPPKKMRRSKKNKGMVDPAIIVEVRMMIIGDDDEGDR